MSYPIYNFPSQATENSFSSALRSSESLTVNKGGNTEILKKYGTPVMLAQRAFTSKKMNGGDSGSIKNNSPSADDFYSNKNFDKMFSNVLH
jgi:hypothetical protein